MLAGHGLAFLRVSTGLPDVRGIIGISGTPGTGKKTVAPLVASLIGLPAPLPIGALARNDEVEVDPRILRRKLLRLNPGRAVVFGHLLPHVLNKSEVRMVAVLRCEPSVLRRRLEGRGYPPEKVVENVEAELIGVVLDECVRKFGSGLVREYDSTSESPKEVARGIARDARAAMAKGTRAAAGAKPGWIDWTLDYDSSSKLRSLLAGRSEPPAST
jgi:adenylate kinase